MLKVGYKKCLFLVVFVASTLLQCFFAQEPCASNPMMNTVVYQGNSFSFPDLFKGGDSVQWQVAPSNEALDSTKDITDASFDGVYNVSLSGLTILNATMDKQGTNPYASAGLYLANFQNHGCTTGAGLVVIDNPPTCYLDISTPPKLKCSITFASYIQQQIVPIMNWTNSSGNVVLTEIPDREGVDENKKGLQSATSAFAVAPGDTSQYSCTVTFSAPQAPTMPSYVAANPPYFTANCSVSSISTTTAATTTTTKAPTTTTPPVTTATKQSTATTSAASTSTSPTQTSTTQMSTTAAAPLNCSIGEFQNFVVYKDSPFWYPNVINRQYVFWQFWPSDKPFEPFLDITDSNGKLNSLYAGMFAVNQSQLTIIKSTMVKEENMPYPTAGLYLLNDQNPPECTVGAGLTVVENLPTCGIDVSIPNKPNFTCSITFANYVQQQINPTMTWINSSGNVVKTETPERVSLDENNLGLQRATSILPVSSDDVTQYHCQVNFGAPTALNLPPTVATNAPNFIAFCNITNNSTTTTTTTTTAATTTSTFTPPTGTAISTTATIPIQLSVVSTNSPITNTAVTPASTPSTTAQQQTGTVVPPESATTSSTISPPASPVSQPGSTVSLSSSSGSTVSMSSSSESTSPSAIQPSTETNGPNTISTIVSTLVNQQSTVSSSSAPVSLLSSSVPVSLSSATTSKAPSLTTAALSNSPRQELVTDDPQVQATSIVLGLVLGSLVTTGLVSACWCYCCFFPIGAKGAKRKQRILLVRRKFLFWRNEPPVEDIYRRNYPPIGRPFQSREPVAPENPWRYPALRKTFHWREPNENGNFWRWDPAANDPYSRRDFNTIET